MKLSPVTVVRTLCLLMLTCIVSVAFAAVNDAGKIIEVWGVPLSYELMLSWCLVPLAFIITEYAPVPNESQPLIPLIFGFIASTVGYQFFGVDAEVAQLQFAAALAAGNFSGLLKHAIPWVAGRIKASKNKDKLPPPDSNPPSEPTPGPDNRIPPQL